MQRMGEVLDTYTRETRSRRMLVRRAWAILVLVSACTGGGTRSDSDRTASAREPDTMRRDGAAMQSSAPPRPVVNAEAGNGQTAADRMYNAVRPKPGETVYTPDPDSPKKYLMDRLNDAARDNPLLAFGQPGFRRGPDGVERVLVLRFGDGSALSFYESPNEGNGTGLRFDSVTISR